MKTVRDILKTKANATIHTISPDATVIEALALMSDKGIGAVLVTENDKVVGILSERDYVRKVAAIESSSYTTLVSDIMTNKVISVSPDKTNEFCMSLMTEGRLRHLPVMDNGQLIGLISIGDLVKDIISDQQSLIRQLENYIRGETP